MKKIRDEFRSFKETDKVLLEMMGATVFFVVLFLLGVALAEQGYVSAAIPFACIFIAVAILAYIKKPRGW